MKKKGTNNVLRFSYVPKLEKLEEHFYERSSNYQNFKKK